MDSPQTVHVFVDSTMSTNGVGELSLIIWLQVAETGMCYRKPGGLPNRIEYGYSNLAWVDGGLQEGEYHVSR